MLSTRAAQKDPEARRKLLFLVFLFQVSGYHNLTSGFQLETRNEKPGTRRFGVRCSEALSATKHMGVFQRLLVDVAPGVIGAAH